MLFRSIQVFAEDPWSFDRSIVCVRLSVQSNPNSVVSKAIWTYNAQNPEESRLTLMLPDVDKIKGETKESKTLLSNPLHAMMEVQNVFYLFGNGKNTRWGKNIKSNRFDYDDFSRSNTKVNLDFNLSSFADYLNIEYSDDSHFTQQIFFNRSECFTSLNGYRGNSLHIKGAHVQGSGFMLPFSISAAPVVVTNSHVVRGNSQIDIEFLSSGKTVKEYKSWRIVKDFPDEDVVFLVPLKPVAWIEANWQYWSVNLPNSQFPANWLMANSYVGHFESLIPLVESDWTILLSGVAPAGTSGAALIDQIGEWRGMYRGFEYGANQSHGIKAEKIIDLFNRKRNDVRERPVLLAKGTGGVGEGGDQHEARPDKRDYEIFISSGLYGFDGRSRVTWTHTFFPLKEPHRSILYNKEKIQIPFTLSSCSTADLTRSIQDGQFKVKPSIQYEIQGNVTISEYGESTDLQADSVWRIRALLPYTLSISSEGFSFELTPGKSGICAKLSSNSVVGTRAKVSLSKNGDSDSFHFDFEQKDRTPFLVDLLSTTESNKLSYRIDIPNRCASMKGIYKQPRINMMIYGLNPLGRKVLWKIEN